MDLWIGLDERGKRARATIFYADSQRRALGFGWSLYMNVQLKMA
jgi:hypothetical protein